MEDFPTIGALCKTIRDNHRIRGTTNELTQKDIEEKSGLSHTYISKFEAGKRTLDIKNFELYVQTLMELVALPLEVESTLMQLYWASKRRARHEECLAQFSFERITQEKDIIRAFKEEKNPSYIVDQLWFVHAFNAPIIRLFNMDLKPERLKDWKAWQAIATKYDPESPVRKAHPEEYRYRYFPPACQRFFNGAGNPFLFTTYMRTLLCALQNLSGDFENLWRTIVSFNNYYPPELDRVIRYTDPGNKEHQITTKIFVRELGSVEILSGQFMTYNQVTWLPEDAPAEDVFQALAKSQAGKNITFACEHIAQYDYNQGWLFPK